MSPSSLINLQSNNLSWSHTYPEGNITRLSSSVPNSMGDKPLETAACSFSIQITECSSDVPSELFTNSVYLQKCVPPSFNPVTVSSVIGISSMAPVDRLIDICLMKMIQSEESEYGIQCGGYIFHLKLVIISFDETIELHSKSGEELIKIATELRCHGVKLFSEKRMEDAFYKFGKAIKYLILFDDQVLQSSDELIEQKKSLMAALKNNLSGLHLSSKNWDTVIKLCSEVLIVEENNVKALYRRGSAFLEIQEHEKAKADLLKAKDLDPTNTAVETKLLQVYQKMSALNEKYAMAMKKMFS